MDKLIPNSTQIPNVILDKLLPVLSEAEMKLFFYICRRTYGFHRSADRISFSQFEHGISTKDDKKLDSGTGLARATINLAVQSLQKLGIILVEGTPKGNVYRVNLEADIDKVVRNSYQYEIHTKTGMKSIPKLVVNSYTQKKEKDRERNTAGHSPAEVEKKAIIVVPEAEQEKAENRANLIPLVIDAFQFNADRVRWYGHKTQRAACQNLIDSYGLDIVLKVIAYLPKSNARPYMPTITTPVQLRDNWEKLKAAALKEKNKGVINKKNVIL